MNTIGSYVQVKKQPTVIRLDHLTGEEAGWISDSYYLTEEVENHLETMRRLLCRDQGSGAFLIGHYGSGKSHFLAYLAQQLEGGAFAERHVFPISLLNYSAGRKLESILAHALELDEQVADRRVAWALAAQRFPNGILLILDELSEFLKSKPDTRAFNEDIRFLQFLGEWAQDHPFWVLAALQEKLEHTGEMEYDLFRKIKDRYPIRLILSVTHVKDLIAQRILVKKEGYHEAVGKLVRQLRKAFPDNPMDYADLANIYPLHPATLSLLEEVRDRFSQARGIVGFAITQLAGDEARHIEPFLAQPWGSLLSPETIVDHFKDLFAVQPEFLPLAQKVFPYFRDHMESLFPQKARRALADRLLKLLVLIHLSPVREGLTAEEAAWWLLYKVSTIQPEKNLQILGKILEEMVNRGAYLKKVGNRYRIDLAESSRETLEHIVERALGELGEISGANLEILIPLLARNEFNPFTLDRDRWRKHTFRWHFHDRELQVFMGDGNPVCRQGPGLQVGLPWGTPPEGRRCFRLVPKPLEITTELKELVVLNQLMERPLPKQVLSKVGERINARASLFAAQIHSAYRQAVLYDDLGRVQMVVRDGSGSQLKDWLRKYGEHIFRHTWPQFERFAPAHGPLPKEAYRQFMAFCLKGDLATEEAPEYVQLIREAYLVPMKLMVRKGRSYQVSPKLDQHELVTIIRPMLDHQPAPKRIFRHLAAPIYGLVPDQVNLLLLLLLVQGEIDILKGRSSLRDLFETLPTPIQYDRIVAGKALNVNQLKDLRILCEGLGIPFPPGGNVLAQRRSALQLRRFAQKQRDQLGSFLSRLGSFGDGNELGRKIEKQIQVWATLEKGESELQSVQHFLFEIGSPRRFLEIHVALERLPHELDRLIKETQRFRHLMAHPVLAESPNLELRLSVEHLGEPPDLSESDALDQWLEAAERIYGTFKAWYSERHEQWWRNLKEHPVWRYRAPDLVHSRHLDLGDTWAELERRRAQSTRSFCRGLSNLDFQAACLCGFDGERAPLGEDLRALTNLMDEIETGLTQFFQQEKVKAKVRDWTEKGLEHHQDTLSYLEDQRPWPEVSDLALFDQHLAGLELFKELDPRSVLTLFRERVWEKNKLLDAFRQLLNKYGPRIAFAKSEEERRESLVVWCLETALRTATPLPQGFTGAELDSMPEMIRPDWVSPKTLDRLERLRLTRACQDRILHMILDGTVPIHGLEAERGLMGAVRALPALPPSETPEALAQLAAVLYRAHIRLVRLARETWLVRLDELANWSLPKEPPALQTVLRDHQHVQWLILDCLGTPFLDLFQQNIRDWLPHWQLARISFALVSERTDTGRFYLQLAEEKTRKAFHKCNVVDQLIHDSNGDFQDLEKRVAAELGIACRKLQNLDPGKPLLIFADHGFRLNKDGTGFGHGGAGTLERLVPVISMKPFV